MPQQLTSVFAEPTLFEKQTQRRQVYDAIAASTRGLTDRDIQQQLRMSGDTQRPRRGELVREGLIEDSGERRLTPSGHESIVWKVRRVRT